MVKEIRTLWIHKNVSSKRIAELYPINPNHVQRVCKPALPRGTCARSLKNKTRKLNANQVRQILYEVLIDRQSRAELAKRYKVKVPTITAIIKGYNWKHVFQGFKKKYNNEILSVEK